MPERGEHAAITGRARCRPQGEEAGLAERRAPVPQPRRHRLRRAATRPASSKATSSVSTTLHREAGRRPGPRRDLRDWIRRFKVDGFRVDTAPHVDRGFFRSGSRRSGGARRRRDPDFEIFGEVAVADAIELSTYTRDRGIPNVLDFPMQDAPPRATPPAVRARSAYPPGCDDDDYFRRRGSDPEPPTFLGNHDMGRAATDPHEAPGPRPPSCCSG